MLKIKSDASAVKVFLAVSILVFGLGLASNSFAQEKRKPVKLEGKQILPLRVLARPFSNVYKEQDPAKGTVMENVPAFQSFYAYSQPKPEDLELGDAWYEVGTDNRGTVIGWMKADDVFEWKQTMCLAYTHPEGRKPVLMFDSRKSLKDLIEAPGEERIKKAEGLYSTIDTRDIPKDFPVISVEPKKAVDISEQFYLLPILDFQTVEMEGREGRVVQLAAVTKAAPHAREKADIRENKSYLEEATGGSTEVGGEVLSKLSMDLVWVMDTTVSMRPYIAKTLDVIKKVSSQITQDQELAQSIRFGIWGYRDPVEEIPGIGYTTKNYNEELQTIDQFQNTLAGVEVTPIDSVDYEEDMFSGMDDALNKTKWTPGAMRFIALVGDAPGHGLGHKWNISGQDENTLRSIADDKSIYVFSIQVKAPKAKRFHEPAEVQFMGMSRNKGMQGESAYWSVSSEDMEGFANITSELASKLSRAAYMAKKGTVVGVAAVAGSGQIPIQSVQAQPGINNDPNLMINNSLPDEGTSWNSEGSVYWSGTEPFVVLDFGGVYQVENLVIQVDHNDEIKVESSTDGTTYAPLLTIAMDKGEIGFGLDTMSTDSGHPEYVEGLAFSPQTARYLKISASGGDNYYAVSELQAFGSPASGVASAAPASKGEMAFMEEAGTQSESGGIIDSMINAAMIDWIGSHTAAKAPRDIIAWAVDKDLMEPAIQSMEVRLLINKRQLDSLKTVLSEVMSAGRRGQIGGEDFFDALQATAATAARDPNQIKNAKSMAKTGLIPEFLEGLPYKSRLMDMNNELWGSWSVDEQDEFLNELDARIQAYVAIHDAPEGWIQLNEGDDADESVYPISLELLP